MKLRAVVAAALLLGTANCVRVLPAQAAVGTSTVRGDADSGYFFDPKTFKTSRTISAQWRNSTPAEHTATSDDGGKTFNVRIATDGQWTDGVWLTGPTRDIPYHCSIHTYMKGVVQYQYFPPRSTTTTIPTTTTRPRSTAVTRTTQATTARTTTTSSTAPATTVLPTTSITLAPTSTTAQLALRGKTDRGNGAAVALGIAALGLMVSTAVVAVRRLRDSP